jgi:hypothetical protein
MVSKDTGSEAVHVLATLPLGNAGTKRQILLGCLKYSNRKG